MGKPMIVCNNVSTLMNGRPTSDSYFELYVRVVIFKWFLGTFLSIKFIIQGLLIINISGNIITKLNNDPQNITVYQASI